MDNNDHSIARWVSILYRFGQSYVSKKIESYNIGSGQYIVLATLYNNNGINQKQMSEYLKIDKAAIAKAIHRLEKEGYIRREIDETDKRAYKVFLTQKALDTESKLYEVIKEWESVLLSGLSKDEKEMFGELLKKIAENATNTSKLAFSAIMEDKNASRS